MPDQPRAQQRLHLALWVVQVLVAASFLMGGGFRGFGPMEELVKNIPWVKDVPAW